MPALDLSDLQVNAPQFSCMLPIDRADIMFPDRGGYDYAKQFCAACPFVEQCRDRNDKIEPNIFSTMYGVVAGETPEERFHRRTPRAGNKGVVGTCKGCSIELYEPGDRNRAHRGRTYWKDGMCSRCWYKMRRESYTACRRCGRHIYQRRTPLEERPVGAVEEHAKGMCSKCYREGE